MDNEIEHVLSIDEVVINAHFSSKSRHLDLNALMADWWRKRAVSDEEAADSGIDNEENQEP